MRKIPTTVTGICTYGDNHQSGKPETDLCGCIRCMFREIKSLDLTVLSLAQNKVRDVIREPTTNLPSNKSNGLWLVLYVKDCLRPSL